MNRERTTERKRMSEREKLNKFIIIMHIRVKREQRRCDSNIYIVTIININILHGTYVAMYIIQTQTTKIVRPMANTHHV